jgi:hypothetical protein
MLAERLSYGTLRQASDEILRSVTHAAPAFAGRGTTLA